MIYVDDIFGHGVYVGSIKGQSCHMFCDTTPEELHAFAVKIGLKRSWCSDITQPKSGLLHYDLVPSKRVLAITHGATMTPRDQYLEITGRCVRQGKEYVHGQQ
jgi:hypothetical protein